MARYGLIVDTVVVNVVEQATAPTIPGNWVLLPDGVGPEQQQQGQNFIARRSTRAATIRGDALLSRLTEAEEAALQVAMSDLPAGSSGVRTAAAELRVWVRRTLATRAFDLRATSTQTWLERLQTAGVIAGGRAAAIVGADVLESERP
jgi:hypothetical protein